MSNKHYPFSHEDRLWAIFKGASLNEANQDIITLSVQSKAVEAVDQDGVDGFAVPTYAFENSKLLAKPFECDFIVDEYIPCKNLAEHAREFRADLVNYLKDANIGDLFCLKASPIGDNLYVESITNVIPQRYADKQLIKMRQSATPHWLLRHFGFGRH